MNKLEKFVAIVNLYWSGMCGMLVIKNVMENNALPAVIFVLLSLINGYIGSFYLKSDK